MAIQDYPAWELKPRKLSPEEIDDPRRVVDEFFHSAHLPQVREMFWELLRTTVTGNYNSALTKRERGDLFYFLEQLEKLIEAAHLIHRHKRTGSEDQPTED